MTKLEITDEEVQDKKTFSKDELKEFAKQARENKTNSLNADRSISKSNGNNERGEMNYVECPAKNGVNEGAVPCNVKVAFSFTPSSIVT